MKYLSENTFSVRTAIYGEKINVNKFWWIVAVGPDRVTGKKRYVRNNKIFAINFTVTNAQYYARQFCVAKYQH
jgi:hypothetical protein